MGGWVCSRRYVQSRFSWQLEYGCGPSCFHAESIRQKKIQALMRVLMTTHQRFIEPNRQPIPSLQHK